VEERFNLQSANWISYVLDRRNQIPDIADPNLVRDTLLAFLGNLIDGMYFHERSNSKTIDKAVQMRDAIRARPRRPLRRYCHGSTRYLFEKGWTAVLIPSGFRESLSADRLLTSKYFLSKLSRTIKTEPHLILQLNEAPQKDFAITDIYPPFHSALSKSTRWPASCSGEEATNRSFSRFRRKHPKMPSNGYSQGWMISRRHRTSPDP